MIWCLWYVFLNFKLFDYCVGFADLLIFLKIGYRDAEVGWDICYVVDPAV